MAAAADELVAGAADGSVVLAYSLAQLWTAAGEIEFAAGRQIALSNPPPFPATPTAIFLRFSVSPLLRVNSFIFR